MGKFKFYFLWLALICIIMFVLQQIPGFTEAFVLNQKVYSGEYWRFITAIFLHGGIIHLMYNLLALLFFGVILEKIIGSQKFLLVFLGSGIIANIVSVNFYDSSLGASGAIYGVLGCLTVIRPLMMVWAFGLIMPLFLAAVVWIAADVLRVLGMFGETNIGSIAHLSGILIGFITGILFRLIEKRQGRIDKKISIPDYYMEAWENKYLRR